MDTRHQGFIAFSPADMAAYFNEQNHEALSALYQHIQDSRIADGKNPLPNVTVIYNDHPAIGSIDEILQAQIAADKEHFYAPVSQSDLLTIIENGHLGYKSDYFDGYTNETPDGGEMVHLTPTGATWAPGTNMVQAMSLAEQFGITVGALLSPEPVGAVIKGEVETYALPEGPEETYSTRLNETILFAVRRFLEKQHGVYFFS